LKTTRKHLFLDKLFHQTQSQKHENGWAAKQAVLYLLGHMKRNRLTILLYLIVVIIATFVAYWKYIWRWEENRLNLEGELNLSIQMQMLVDDFNEQSSHFPTLNELTHLLPYINTSFNDNTVRYYTNEIPYNTYKIAPAFDNSGGWFYDEKVGEVRINYSGQYYVGIGKWVDLSKIDFRRQTRVEVNCFGRPQILDYTWLNKRLDTIKPQIAKIITTWAATNVVATKSKGQ
jgi:hypothetical protein